MLCSADQQTRHLLAACNWLLRLCWLPLFLVVKAHIWVLLVVCACGNAIIMTFALILNADYVRGIARLPRALCPRPARDVSLLQRPFVVALAWAAQSMLGSGLYSHVLVVSLDVAQDFWCKFEDPGLDHPEPSLPLCLWSRFARQSCVCPLSLGSLA